MTRSLVIGGTLFIGKALVRRLLARGEEVTILHRGRQNPFAGRVTEIHCDRNDTQAVRQALEGNRFKVVYDNVYDWRRGTSANQVEAAASSVAPELRRYVFMSSVAVYQKGLNVTEEAPLVDSDCPEDYPRNKAESERSLLRLHRESGFPAATLRPTYVYGAENPFYREAFFWDRLTADRPILIPGDGSRLMQLVLADDVARAAIAAADTSVASGRAYNVCEDEPITQDALVDALARAAGRKAKKRYVPRKRLLEFGGNQFQPPYYFGQYFDMPPITEDNRRARRELGFEPTPLAEGLAEAFGWYRAQTNRPEPDFSWEDRILGSLGA